MEFRITQSVILQKVIIADDEETPKREFEEQLDNEFQVESFDTDWSKVGAISLEQERLNYIESKREEEYDERIK